MVSTWEFFAPIVLIFRYTQHSPTHEQSGTITALNLVTLGIDMLWFVKIIEPTCFSLWTYYKTHPRPYIHCICYPCPTRISDVLHFYFKLSRAALIRVGDKAYSPSICAGVYIIVGILPLMFLFLQYAWLNTLEFWKNYWRLRYALEGLHVSTLSDPSPVISIILRDCLV